MNSLSLNESPANLDSVTARGEKVDADGYRYDTFHAGLLLNDARFPQGSLKPGEVLSDRALVSTDGEEISLRDLSDGRPIALMTGSLTCPLSISTIPLFGELNHLYGKHIAFAFIYTREAHPGESIRQPHSLAEKIVHARLLQEIHGVEWPILADDIDGTLHRALDSKQNSVHIVAPDGTILFRALFAGDPAVATALTEIANGRELGRTQASGRLAAPMKSIGYIEETVIRAGSQAWRDVIKAVPPMAAMAVLARAFPFLPRASRGWAVAGMLIWAAAAMVGTIRLLS